MAGFKGVHWLSPTIMTSALAAAVGLALGHHFFYHSLDGHDVAPRPYNIAGRQLPRQQFNTAVGTAFAFLVQSLLGIANSTAYIQMFWAIARHKKNPTISELDWADGVVHNVFTIFDVRKWRKFSPLVLAAAVFWCIPIATIFPPATLVVNSVQTNSSSFLQVLNVDFTSFAYSAPLQAETFDGNVWTFAGASQPLQNLAVANAASGVEGYPASFPTPPTTAANATWAMKKVPAPMLFCSAVTGAKRGNIWKNIWNSYNQSKSGPQAYLSWVPWSDFDARAAGFNVTAGRPHFFDRDLPYYLNGTALAGPSAASVSTDGPVSLFVAVIPGAYDLVMDSQNTTNVTVQHRAGQRPDLSPWILSPCPYLPIDDFNTTFKLNCSASFTPQSVFNGASLMRCDVYNVTLDMNFDYSNITRPLKALYDSTNPPLNGTRSFVGPDEGLATMNESSIAAGNYCAPFIADPLPLLGNNFNHPTEPLRGTCIFDPQSLRLLSYQSLMSAFHQTFRGSIGRGNVQSSIVNTVFMGTTEMNWLSQLVGDAGYDDRYQISNLYAKMPLAVNLTGTAARPISAGQGALAVALEDAWDRMIFSLLAQQYFQPNYSSPFAPRRLTNVTTSNLRNVYQYDAITLWTAYGLALLFSTLVFVAGWVAMYLNGSSYSDSFSTLIRVGRMSDMVVRVKPENGKENFKRVGRPMADLVMDIRPEDASGSDPLPKYLKRARMDIEGLVKAATPKVLTRDAASSQASAPEIQPLVADADDAGQWAGNAQSAVLRSSGEGQGNHPAAAQAPPMVQHPPAIPRRPVAQSP